MEVHAGIQVTTEAPSAEERGKVYVAELRRRLGVLAQDMEISKTLERKGSHALYDLLLRRQRSVRLTDRALIQDLLRQNYVFAEPVRCSPALMTFNGIGVRLLGSRRRTLDDGTRIATQFVTFLYLPIFPVAQYIGTPGPKGSWQLLGRLPLRPSYRYWLGAGYGIIVVLVLSLAMFCASSMAGASR